MSVGPEERFQQALYKDKSGKGHRTDSAGRNKSRPTCSYTTYAVDAADPQATAYRVVPVWGEAEAYIPAGDTPKASDSTTGRTIRKRL